MAASVGTPQPSTAATAATLSGDIKEPSLPKIAPHEFREYNRMADMMEYYVSNLFPHLHLSQQPPN